MVRMHDGEPGSGGGKGGNNAALWDYYNQHVKNPPKGSQQPTSGGKGGAAHQPGGNGGKGGGFKGGRGGGGGVRYKGLGKPPKYNWKQASNIIQHQVNAEIKKLLQDLKAQKRDKRYTNKGIRQDYRASVGDLNYIFNEAADGIRGQNQQVMNRFAQAGTDTQNMFNQFMQQSATDTAARKGEMTDELARLGIQGVGTGQFDADAANAQNVMGINNQNAMANLTAMQEGAASANAMLQNMVGASQAQKLGQATRDRDQAIQANNHEFNQYMHDIMAQVRNIRAGKWSSINELAMALQEQKFNQALAWRQANFDNQMAVNGLNLDRAQLNASNMWNMADLQQDNSYWGTNYQNQQAGNQYNNLSQAFADLIGGTVGGLNPFGKR